MQQQMNQNLLESIKSNIVASGLKEKLIFTFVMIALFRFGAHLPIYGIDNQLIQSYASQGNLVGLLNMFSGGALATVSIFALGIGPYITSSIIMQLLAVVIPYLEKLQKEEGEAGRRQIQQITRQFAVVLALFQSLAVITILHKVDPGGRIIMSSVNPFLFTVGAVVTLTAGSALVMWMAEMMTERGVGNGGSLLIFVGIISGIPWYIKNTATLVSNEPSLQLPLLFLLAIFVATVVFIIIVQDAVRKVPIQSARRQVGRKVYGGGTSSIPFKLNPGGVMPIIFAVAIMIFPATIVDAFQHMNIQSGFFGKTMGVLGSLFSHSSPYYYVIYFFLIVGFTFFYASIIPSMQPKEIADNLKKYGSSIPGIKPGAPTAAKLDEILTKTTFIGAFALGFIALSVSLASKVTGITTFQGIGSTSLIIMVGVALDFVNQIRTHMLARNYESFLQNNDIK